MIQLACDIRFRFFTGFRSRHCTFGRFHGSQWFGGRRRITTRHTEEGKKRHANIYFQPKVHGYSPELIRLLLATETPRHKEKVSASSPYPPLEGDTGGGGNFEIPVPQDAQIICLVI